ncbi:hypothetical protein EIP91_009706, partial [Steccherinum ochraceum]
MRYAPQKVYEDCMAKNRVFDEMWTADWWWDLQKKLPEGATVAPLILASDKTHLTNFRGDKQAWPVYLSIGNIAKSVRKKTSSSATILIGYLPVTKLEIFPPGDERTRHGQELFHRYMKKLLVPLIKAGRDGVEMTCADGQVRNVFPILAAYVADFPEQCLVACVKENRCPRCTVAVDGRGDPNPVNSVLRDPEKTVRIMREAGGNVDYPKLEKYGIRPNEPFWVDLPHCNIFSCFTPDLLHQLHNGVFGDHTRKWGVTAVRSEMERRHVHAPVSTSVEEVNMRFQAMPQHDSMRHFRRGISVLANATGTEHKDRYGEGLP